MKKIAMTLAASLMLASCAASTANTVYSVSAKVQGSADTLYIAAEKAGEALVATGVITREQFLVNENKAYAALLVLRTADAAVRAAADAGANTSQLLLSEATALAEFNAALVNLQQLVGVTPTAATTL